MVPKVRDNNDKLIDQRIARLKEEEYTNILLSTQLENLNKCKASHDDAVSKNENLKT